VKDPVYYPEYFKICEVAVPNCLSLKLWIEIVASILELQQLFKHLYKNIAKCMSTQAAFLAWRYS